MFLQNPITSFLTPSSLAPHFLFPPRSKPHRAPGQADKDSPNDKFGPTGQFHKHHGERKLFSEGAVTRHLLKTAVDKFGNTIDDSTPPGLKSDEIFVNGADKCMEKFSEDCKKYKAGPTIPG